MTSDLPSLTSLLKQTHIEDDASVLRAANATLKQSKGDLEAQHIKVVALLKLDRYDEALRTLETGGKQLQDQARLEHAYVLYKSGKTKAAAELAQEQTGRAFQHVEAQARYRLEDFERAANIYRSLSSDVDGDAEADLRVNGSAVDAQLQWAGQEHLVANTKPGREDLEAFETAYNAACGSIARGQLGQAEVLLKRARDLCTSLEDLSDQDKAIELLPISVQQLYVLSKLGRERETQALAEQLDASLVTDATTQHIARINQLCASNTAANPYLVQRLLDQALATASPDSPFDFQSAVLKRNSLASDLLSHKFAGAAKATNTTLNKEGAARIDPSVNYLSAINAAAIAQGQVGKQALKSILPALRRRSKDVGLALAVSQLHIKVGNYHAAVSTLQSLFSELERSETNSDLEVRFAPGLVGSIVSLYEKQGQRAHARLELSKASSYWVRQTTTTSGGIIHLLKAAATALLSSPDSRESQLALKVFQHLHQQDPQDAYAAAGYLAASASTGSDASGVTLTPVDRLVSGIDVDALEAAGIAQPPSALSSTATATKKRPAEEAAAKKSKKTRTSRLPKDYDPNKKPDPERWLPLRDRSSYRPKGKKGKARQALLSQGAVQVDPENSKPAAPSAEVIKQKQGAGGASSNKKKKGKGNKW